MAVMIRGMEMPNGCECCKLGFDAKEGIYCRATLNRVVRDVLQDFPDWCPLVEIPTPHGKIIDSHLLLTLLWGITQKCKQGKHMPFLTFATVESVVEDAPTIIEAEE